MSEETKTCQCEHVAHFEHERRTPNGNPGHDYGVQFATVIRVATDYGVFAVCLDCWRDCWGHD